MELETILLVVSQKRVNKLFYDEKLKYVREEEKKKSMIASSFCLLHFSSWPRHHKPTTLSEKNIAFASLIFIHFD